MLEKYVLKNSILIFLKVIDKIEFFDIWKTKV